MCIKDRIERLRQKMEEHHISVYMIPTADYHQSEYVGEHFKSRAFITGFTGSAGTAVITKEESCLWTDGRYFLQAESQLQGSGIRLQKMGEPGVPTIAEYIESVLGESENIGFDGRTIGITEGEQYEKIAKEKHGQVYYGCDLIDEIWEERPAQSEKPAFYLEETYTGESTASKLKRVRERMEKENTGYHLLTSLDDIDWLLNVRGQDVEYFPLLLSYALITMDSVELYADERKFDENILKHFEECQVHLHPYNAIYEDVKSLPEGASILLDPQRVNYALYRNIPKAVRIVKEENPEVLMKCVKNAAEIENIRRGHIKDGVAHTKFMYWLKKHAGKETITELSASEKLENFRKEQEGYLWPSFDPICAYGQHAAIVHYSSTPETNVELKEGGLFLTDTGGNYYDGSTDITRTVAIGEVDEKQKKDFTMVACSMLRLADAKFLAGCSGMVLDYAAREPFWRRNLNYNHGTGHGVGYLGNIHEAPIGFRWKATRDAMCEIEPGMVITNEPGIYIEGSHGIRIENELLVRAGEKNEYGQFLYFEPLTFVPIDLDALRPELMTEEEKQLLNAYHQSVYEKISPYLEAEEKEWLKEYTRPVK